MHLFEAIFSDQSLSSVAVLFGQRQMTYEELRDQTLSFARVWQTLGINPGERVGILLHDSPEFVAAFISICSSGAIAVPVNLALGLDEQRAILNDCTAQTAIVERDLCSSLLTDAPEQLRHFKEVIVVCREEDSTTETPQVQTNRGEGPRIRLLSKLQKEGEGRAVRFPSPGPDTPALILYTSGSTGKPKGAVHCQSDIFYTNQTFCREVLGLRPGDRLFSSSRLPFAYGLGNSLSFPLLNGATTVLCRQKPTPDVVGGIFASFRPTVFFGVPVVYKLLLDHHARGNRLDCSALRLCISAGEALPAQLGENWQNTFGVEVLDGIGSTEMMHMFMSNHEGKIRYGSSGTLLQGYEARLLNEHGEPSPPESEGNLWIKGASAARGYWQRPEETARTFIDSWVRTGDLYRRDGEGYWFHMGRSDDCFKSSGQWVSPVEVESVLLRHRGVSQAAVVEDFDVDGLPCACAFVICNEVESRLVKLEEELRQLSRAALARFKQPRKYLFVDELPYTATGKIQRFKLRELLKTVQSPTSNVQGQSPHKVAADRSD